MKEIDSTPIVRKLTLELKSSVRVSFSAEHYARLWTENVVRLNGIESKVGLNGPIPYSEHSRAVLGTTIEYFYKHVEEFLLDAASKLWDEASHYSRFLFSPENVNSVYEVGLDADSLDKDFNEMPSKSTRKGDPLKKRADRAWDAAMMQVQNDAHAMETAAKGRLDAMVKQYVRDSYREILPLCQDVKKEFKKWKRDFEKKMINQAYNNDHLTRAWLKYVRQTNITGIPNRALMMLIEGSKPEEVARWIVGKETGYGMKYVMTLLSKGGTKRPTKTA